ncbi:polysaccharide biosynthesis-like protein [Fulvimarina endophytica]|uniref:Polysaccharide biosynthesis-like protein n=2 Tax=Fulvimarina endophytica TaxID=2293836 RepID=A0A371WYV8_9HYPH|nr:polysaccharide biosynthesis-like protein [Fulvimarina endophytica]
MLTALIRLPLYLRVPLRVFSTWLRLGFAQFMYLASFVRTGPFVRRVRTGSRSLNGARDVCVVVHFDRGGRVHDFLMYYLYQLHAIGFEIVFVSNAEALDESDVGRLEEISALIVERRNVGYDFGAWKDGIDLIPDLEALDRLLLVNDSVYGPIHHLGPTIDRMNPEDADVWGMTDSWDFNFHLQSYFMLFHAAAIRSDAFARFWKSVRYVQSKTFVIRRYEVGVSRAMMRGRMRCRAAFAYRDCARHLVRAVVESDAIDKLDPVRQAFVRQLYKTIDAGVPLNVTHFFWDHLIAKMGFPFIKRELLQKNPARIPLLNYWETVVEANSDYDTNMILEHLELTLKNRTV